MKVTEILQKSLDIITAQPEIILPYIVPVILAVVSMWMRIKNMMDWGIGRLSLLVGGPFKFYTELVPTIRLLKAADWGMWIVFLIVLAICVALTIVMTNAQLLGKEIKVGQAFDTIRDALPFFIVAFLVCWLLKFVGMFFFWIGVLIPSVLLIFVGQYMLLGSKGILDSFMLSYDLAKKNWFEILLLLVLFLVILAIVRYVAVLGVIVACFLAGYSAVVFTILYNDRK